MLEVQQMAVLCKNIIIIIIIINTGHIRKYSSQHQNWLEHSV